MLRYPIMTNITLFFYINLTCMVSLQCAIDYEKPCRENILSLQTTPSWQTSHFFYINLTGTASLQCAHDYASRYSENNMLQTSHLNCFSSLFFHTCYKIHFAHRYLTTFLIPTHKVDFISQCRSNIPYIFENSWRVRFFVISFSRSHTASLKFGQYRY